MNTSATGGPLLPIVGGPAPLEGRDLLVFLNGWLAGVTGLDQNLVRGRWQTEPPNIPNAGEAWMAYGIGSRPADDNATIYYDADALEGAGATVLQQHEELDVLCSFYDMGSTGLADSYAAVLRQGLQVDQNLEPLVAQGMGLITAGPAVALPSLLKTRWLYRVDVPVSIKREIIRYYPILTVEEVEAALIAGAPGGATFQRDIVATRN